MAAVIDRTVERAAERLAEVTHAEAVILFGSRARGDHGPESDWDLCVILPDDVRPQQFTAASLWREVAAFGIPIQVYPVRRSVFIEKSSDVNSVSHDVLKDGLSLIGDLGLLVSSGATR